MAWQRANVGVAEHSNDLTITDLETGDTIAVHELCAEKGRTVKNTHHYRDHAQRIVDLEQAIAALIPHETAAALCAVLKRTSPRIYKDQQIGRAHVELQSLMRISYAVFCLKNTTARQTHKSTTKW